MREVVEAIEAAAPDAAGRIIFEDAQLPFREELEASALEEAIGPVRVTPLREGVRDSIAHFSGLARAATA